MKKLFTILMACCMAFSLLTGCGSTESGVMDTAHANAVAGGNSDLPVITWKMGSTWGSGNVHYTVDLRLLPVDTVVADGFPNPIDGPIDVETVAADKIPADKEGLDIGEETRKLFADAAKAAKTVVWNGPMGVFENPTLAKGTIAVAEALAESEATTIVGGGDSAAACEQLGFADKITHISTGGGASLEFLEGKELPGIACLQDK